MAAQLNSDGNFNELVFENRNKEYGAYAIRQSYNETVTKSLLIAFSFICALLAIGMFLSQGEDKLPDLGPNKAGVLPGIIVDIPIPEKKIIPITKPEVKQKDPEPPKTETGQFQASNDKKDVLNKTNEELKIANVNNHEGSDSAAGPDIKAPVEIATAVEDNKVQAWVDHMPEFNGNVYQFIKNHMNYPQVAVENGTQGMVVLSFIIEKDGSIGDIKVLNSVADGCTQEAIRVVRMMPKWKPGQNQNQPVRVQFNLPIRFTLKS